MADEPHTLIKKINDGEFLAEMQQRNAYYRGLLASKRLASKPHQIPTAPQSIDRIDKVFWYIGVHVGTLNISKMSESPALTGNPAPLPKSG